MQNIFSILLNKYYYTVKEELKMQLTNKFYILDVSFILKNSDKVMKTSDV